jgi:hypothetical protein
MIQGKLIAYIKSRLKENQDQIIFTVPTPPHIRTSVAKAFGVAASQINATDRTKLTADYLYAIIGSALSEEGLNMHSNVASFDNEVVVRFFVEMAVDDEKKTEPLVMFARVPRSEVFKERRVGSDEATVERLLKRRKAV